MLSGCTLQDIELKEFNDLQDIERTIIKKYRAKLWTPFIKGVLEYKLIENNDKIAVCISGGKDSLLMAKLMQELQRHSDLNFELEFIAMNPGFTANNLALLQHSCEQLQIPVKILDTEIFAVVDKIANNYPCYMCARMRRGALYSFAEELGCNKIALGHHFNDFIETTLLNVLYAGNYATMLPKLAAKNYEGMQLIRPLVYVREQDIINYTKHNQIQAMNCGCVVAAKQTSSKRSEIKQLIKDLKKINPDVEKSIFASSKNVNLDMILGWQEAGQQKTFLEKEHDEN